MSPLRLTRRPTRTGPDVLVWQQDPVPWEFTDADVAREAHVLDELATETARTDPLAAARQLFGGTR